MSDWTICITPMPTEEALDVAARIADAEEPDCEDLLLTEGARVCDVLRCEVLHQAEVIERRTAELSTATGEIARLRAALAEAHAIIEGRKAPPTEAEIAAHTAAVSSFTLLTPNGTYEAGSIAKLLWLVVSHRLHHLVRGEGWID